MADEIIIETTSAEVIEVGTPGPQGPAGTAGTGLETLTTKGDTLYRGEVTGERLPIGTTGQILRVSASGLPEWGAAPASGVSSVNGETGAVTLTPADLDAAEANHTHNSADLFFQGLEILGAGNANTNGVYVYGGDLNGKGVYYKDKDTFVYWDGAAWMISHNADDIYSSAQNTTTPWQVTSWSVEAGQASPAPSSWDRVTGDQWEAVVGQRTNPTLRGDAAGKNVGTEANDVAAGNDARFTDARQPLSHSSTHHTGGTDAIAPSSIGAQTLFTSTTLNLTANTTLTAARATNYSVINTGNYTITLPTTGHLVGDIVVVRYVAGTGTLSVTWGAGGQSVALNAQYRFIATGTGATNWALVNVDTHTHTTADITSGTLDIARIPTGTSGSTVCIGNDARLSDARTPTSHTHAASDITSGSFGNISHDGKLGSTAGLPVVTTTAGAVTTLALGTAGQVLTVNSGATGVEFAAASGGGVTTGSVDNAVLRADGTGGSTSQSSDLVIDDATTSTQNNVTISNQHSGQTNSALVLAPKGNGPLLGQKPNGAASGGNSRGNYATDFQRERGTNSRVASGNYSVICGGFNNSATNTNAFVGTGDGNQATGSRSAIVTGDANTASGERSFIGAGNNCTASGAYSAILSGSFAIADRASLHVHANGRFGGVSGSAQRIHGIYFGTTTTNSAATIVNLSVPASKVIAAIINIVGVKSDGSASAHFVRQYSVKNSGGTTSQVYAAQTIGTDSAASTSVTLSASDATDQLVVECTGIVSETWRWVASVDAVEVSWAT